MINRVWEIEQMKKILIRTIRVITIIMLILTIRIASIIVLNIYVIMKKQLYQCR